MDVATKQDWNVSSRAIPKAQKAQKVFEICSERYEKLTKSSETPTRCLSFSENA